MLDPKVEKLMDEKFKENLKKFKPRFGVQSDIDLVKSIERIGKLQKEVDYKISQSKGAEKLKEELSRYKRAAINQLEKII